MKLYELTSDIRDLSMLAEEGELTLEDIADTMAGLSGMFEHKAEAVLKVRQSMLNDIAQINAEIERLSKLKNAPQHSADRLTEYLKINMMGLDKDKLDLPLFKVTLRKATKKLGAIDENKVPLDYFVKVPPVEAYYKLDKRALLSAAKKDAIEGVELIDTERNLKVE